MFVRPTILALSVFFTACAAVPLGRQVGDSEKPRPVQPLPWQGQARVPVKQAPTKGFKVADPTAKPITKASPKAIAKVDNAAIAAKMTAADDKASSARSMAQSAQTKDDWNLVFAQWKRAIQILKEIPTKTAPVQQKLTEYQNGLEEATQAAKISLNPSLAPVDEVGARAKGVIGVPAEKPSPQASPSPSPQASPPPSPQASP